ncbi:MAG: penicillin-binding protein 2 [Alphaproteobacteria bacterium]|nr:penicillin-binding protein 2 [Alphaproteobacteria bacterium]MBU0795684.1 penicillin-binding protein 2 [Alphaproteobacteria bacterium]MBU0887307.1 penicillin-binding protein 2 [Alphaproteobacteria bacterium]MBU1811812.1 penicillin-binding protein 2 [Alphaproteobacteria bacterium]MBU2091033.1 penicillin-binding protein 2 [Alphaproteobacteria bacterium]
MTRTRLNLRTVFKRAPNPDVPPPSHHVALEGHVRNAIETGRTRLVIAAALFAVAFGAVGVRLADVTVMNQGAEPRLADAARATIIQSSRSEIIDRNGLLLATSLHTPSLYADPMAVLDPVEAAQKLATVLPGISEQEIIAKLATERRFVWIRRNLTPRQQFDINRLGIPGFYFQREEKRVYPQSGAAAHVVGYTDVDGRGIAGIEQSFDEVLRSGGQPVQLSLDLRLQHIVRESLLESMTEFQAIGAAGVVLDARNGEVLAMVSLPDFDPNQTRSLDPDAQFNRATLGVYEMGSTFKVFNHAMALDSGKVRLNGGFDASHPIRIARFTISDYHGKNRWLSVPEIFEHSSNIGSAKMAMEVGVTGQHDFMKKIGMLSRLPIEIPEAGVPLAPSPWREINLMTISFGHGLSVSPMHLVSGVSAMVNGGILRPVTLLKREPGATPPGARVISERTSDQMRRLLRLVVENGTGRNASAEGYLVGGKTGTAEKLSGRGYNRKARISSFVGAFPINDPKYIVLAMIDEPVGNKRTFGYATGGWVAAPVVKNIVRRMAPMYGISPVDENAPEIRRDLVLDIAPRDPTKNGGKHLASY